MSLHALLYHSLSSGVKKTWKFLKKPLFQKKEPPTRARYTNPLLTDIERMVDPVQQELADLEAKCREGYTIKSPQRTIPKPILSPEEEAVRTVNQLYEENSTRSLGEYCSLAAERMDLVERIRKEDPAAAAIPGIGALFVEGHLRDFISEYSGGSLKLKYADTALIASQKVVQDIQERLPAKDAKIVLEDTFGMAFTEQPLEERLDIVAAYNQSLSGRQRYKNGAKMAGLESVSYRKRLQEHVQRCRESYQPGRRPERVLQRFDRTLLPDYDAFQQRMAEKYMSCEKTLQEITQEVSEEYGMQLSTSHLSHIARSYLKKEGTLPARRPRRPS